MTTNKRELQLHCCFQTIPFHVVNIVNPPPYLQKNLKLVKNFIVNDKITASLKTNMCSKLYLFQTLQTPPPAPLPPPQKKKETRKNCKANSHGIKIGKYLRNSTSTPVIYAMPLLNIYC